MADQPPEHEEGTFEVPQPPPEVERSLELPAVILGDRGDDEGRPLVRLLPGRLPEAALLYPAYSLVGIAASLSLVFATSSGEWNPVMVVLVWSLLLSWYWVYGVAYRYRRPLMKLFSFLMGGLTASILAFVTSLRARPMRVPSEEGVLMLRDAAPSLRIAAILTALSFVVLVAHLLYFGRGYREKVKPGIQRVSPAPPSTESSA